MNIKQILAGGLAAVMAGATMGVGAFGLGLNDYPSGLGYVSASGSNFLMVYGPSAHADDIGSAINVALRLGGDVVRVTEPSGTGAGGLGVVLEGEGKGVESSKALYLDQQLGKTGLRSTFTKDEMPTLLATSTLTDSDASSSHKMTQQILTTPGSTTSSNYLLEFDRPGGKSSINPQYNHGQLVATATNTDYYYRTYVSSDKGINGTTAIGESVVVFGKEYTIHSDTTFISSAPQLVLAGSGKSLTLSGGQTEKVTLAGKEYTVGYVASSDSDTGIIKVNTDQKSVDQGKTATVGGIDVFMERVFDVSSTDSTQDSAKVQFGAEKLTLKDGTTVKRGANDDAVSGTFVNLSISSGKLDGFYVHVGALSTAKNFLQKGESYEDPVWKTLKIDYPNNNYNWDNVANEPDGWDKIELKASGSNAVQLTIPEKLSGKTVTQTFAYKGASTDMNFTLADGSGYLIHTVENDTIRLNEYFTTESGDFYHLWQLTGLSVDATSSSNVELKDVFAGTTKKVTLGTDDKEATTIDGQTVNFWANATAITQNSGTGSTFNSTGIYRNYGATLKLLKGATLAIWDGGPTNITAVGNGTVVDTPFGALNFSIRSDGNVATSLFNITAVSKENGRSSAISTSPTTLNLTQATPSGTVTLGKTTTGGVILNVSVTSVAAGNVSVTFNIKPVGGTGSAGLTLPSVWVIEEEDDNSDVYAWGALASTEVSGSDNVAIATTGAARFTYRTSASGTGFNGVTGSSSTQTHYVDRIGLYVMEESSGANTVTAYAPDKQVKANEAVLAVAPTASAAGATSAVSASSAVVTDPLAKSADNLVAADLEGKNLLVFGGPAVNKVAADLLGVAFPTTGEASKVPKDQALIQLFEAPTYDLFNNAKGKNAILVAGWEKEHTAVASAVLQSYDTAANKAKLKGTKVVLDATGAVVAAASSPAASPAAT